MAQDDMVQYPNYDPHRTLQYYSNPPAQPIGKRIVVRDFQYPVFEGGKMSYVTGQYLVIE